jgi:hypothetical protein
MLQKVEKSQTVFKKVKDKFLLGVYLYQFD